MSRYETPLGDLHLDRDVNEELLRTGSFEVMSCKVDEEEHSLELHLPYLAHLVHAATAEVVLVPVLVGNLSERAKARYGQIFAQYLTDPSNLFVVSSDFCHWGQRFRYQHYDKSKGEIYQSIEALDREGMQFIEAKDAKGFAAYLRQCGNTICGRNPIAVLLAAIVALGVEGFSPELRFVQYAQSSKVRSM